MNSTDIILACLDKDTTYTCRKSSCNLPELEHSTALSCCHKCSLDILAEHDSEVRKSTIQDILNQAEVLQIQQVKSLEAGGRRNGRMWSIYMNMFFEDVKSACMNMLDEV